MGRSLGGGEGHGEEETGGIADCSPGTIVWVRRRNGSWWPGRILGHDELRAAQVVSPKTGTPVKLLGREDASIDWYNVEKSKRVKEFRCGEFDACIEKAKSCQETTVKRREKYARREDAILHALELERKQLALKYQNQGFGADGTCSIPFADTGRQFEDFYSEYYPRNHLQSSTTQQCKDLSTTRYKSKKSKKRKVDNSAVLSKTKVCKKNLIHDDPKNFSESLAWGASDNTLSNHINGFSHLGHMHGGSSVESGGNNAALKNRGSDERVFEESVVKKHDGCRPLAQVVQSSVQLPYTFQRNDDSSTVLIGGKDPIPALCQAKRSGSRYLCADSGDTHSHEEFGRQMNLTEDYCETESFLKQSDSFSGEQTFSDLFEKHGSHGSGSSVRECSETETEDDTELLQRYSKKQSPESDTCHPNSLQASNKLRHAIDNDDDDEVTLSTFIPQRNVLEDEDGSSELGVSQWHIKGKRNQRGAAKRSVDKTDGNVSLDKSNSFMKGALYMANEGGPKVESIGASVHHSFGQTFPRKQEELESDSDETDLIDKVASHSEVNRYIGKGYSTSSKPTRDIGRSYASFNDSEISCKTSPLNKNGDHLGQKPYWEGSSLYQQNYGSHLGYMGPVLFNVDLKVQASYQGERVPLVSLMSRLNGKAIVGHPIQIEILEDGSTDHLVLDSDIVPSTAPRPAWRTGRRTAMPRVPRSGSSQASLDGDGSEGLWEMKPPFDRLASPVNQHVKLSKKNISSVRRPLLHKSQNKPSNHRKGNSSSQKLRALSSISIGKRHHRGSGQANANRCSDIFGGFIKSEGAVPLVTCVPAKVVFSRIMEAVGRPSLAFAHRARMAIPSVRDPP